MKEAIWLVIALAAWVAWMAYKTNRLNQDEIQNELCALIKELDRSPEQGNNITIFTLGYNRALMFADGSRSTRLSHALSMARPSISADTYAFVKTLFRQDVADG